MDVEEGVRGWRGVEGFVRGGGVRDRTPQTRSYVTTRLDLFEQLTFTANLVHSAFILSALSGNSLCTTQIVQSQLNVCFYTANGTYISEGY